MQSCVPRALHAESIKFVIGTSITQKNDVLGIIRKIHAAGAHACRPPSCTDAEIICDVI